MRIQKLMKCALTPSYWPSLIQGVAPAVEHRSVLNRFEFDTVVDAGANKGQFAAMATALWPNARVHCFEPLPRPRAKLAKIVPSKTRIHACALGAEQSTAEMHIASREDSSSLLKLGQTQQTLFNMHEVEQLTVPVERLDAVLPDADLDGSSLLKVDVQGFEYELLQGAEGLLHKFDAAYIECSFVELYEGQKLIDDVTVLMEQAGFGVEGHYNVQRDDDDKLVQADILFLKRDAGAKLKRTENTRLLMLGELPPPLTGNSSSFENVSSEIASIWGEKAQTLNVSARGRGKAFKAIQYLQAWLSILLRSTHQRLRLYMVCEGDAGLPLTAMTLRLAGLLAIPVYLHHHSYGYIIQPRPQMARINRLLGERGRHIFLSDAMAADFNAVYRSERDYRVIDNLSQMAEFAQSLDGVPREQDSDVFRVGLLSNLTFEKGLGIFLDVAKACVRRKLDIRFVLAGPVAGEAERTALEQAQTELGAKLDYLGPVYADEKARFFSGIELFLFPTRYYHEAQPIVLYEALIAGNSVLSADRGCISAQLAPYAGIVIPDKALDSPDTIADRLQALSEDRKADSLKRGESASTIRDDMIKAEQDRAELIGWMT